MPALSFVSLRLKACTNREYTTAQDEDQLAHLSEIAKLTVTRPSEVGVSNMQSNQRQPVVWKLNGNQDSIEHGIEFWCSYSNEIIKSET